MCAQFKQVPTLLAADSQGLGYLSLLFWVESLVEGRCQGSEHGFWNIHRDGQDAGAK